MAKYFYFTRHGQTVWNVENKICGATDIALTDLGHQQAAELGERILKEGIKIDEILYSPLMRAADTAKHISEVTGIPAREELRLKEQNFGKYESTPRNGEEFKRAKQDFVCRYEGGESMLQLCQRICNLLDDIKKDVSVTTYTDTSTSNSKWLVMNCTVHIQIYLSSIKFPGGKVIGRDADLPSVNS